jgi:hypothetical protein
MRRFIGCVGVLAMLVALLTAPLFHAHDRDDHADRESRVHAHLPEAEETHPHSDPESGSRHSHDRAHWVDFFVFHAPPSDFDLAVDFTERLSVPALTEQEEVVLFSTPRAHGPPTAQRSRPRSPPAI